MDDLQRALTLEITEQHRVDPHPGLTGARLRLHLGLHVTAELQIRKGEPPEVAQTLDRLMRQGLDRHQAVHAICTVVAEEVMQVVAGAKKYDEQRYVKRLLELIPQSAAELQY